MVTYEFPASARQPGVKVVWLDGGLRPPRPEGLPDETEMGSNGRLIIGDQGFILGNKVFPDKRRQEFPEPPKLFARSAGHYKEWIAACKGGPPAGSNFDWAGPLAEIVLLGNVALRVQLREEVTFKTLRWDPVQLRFSNSEEANKYVRREYRQGWSL